MSSTLLHVSGDQQSQACTNMVLSQTALSRGIGDVTGGKSEERGQANQSLSERTGRLQTKFQVLNR